MSNESSASEKINGRPQTPRRWYALGLQTKGALIIFYIVIGVVLAGGGFYYRAVGKVVKNIGIEHAIHQGKALGLASEGYLKLPPQQRAAALGALTRDLQKCDSIPIPYVAITDAEGKVISSAGIDTANNEWSRVAVFPVASSIAEQYGENYLVIARPVLSAGQDGKAGGVIGGIRLVVDISGSNTILSSAKRGILLTGCAIVFFAISLGYILVWQFMVKPIRSLVDTTNQFAGGNYDARSNVKRSDETGELAGAFNEMASQVGAMQKRLVEHNAELETKVDERTHELQNTNDQLVDAMRDKEQFLRAVSHDLNAPLRNIGGMATVIKMKWGGVLPEEVVTRLGRIQSNVEMQSSMLDELLELSRINSQKGKRQTVDVAEMIDALKGAFEFELQNRNIEFKVDGQLPSLCVESNRLRQVLQNLIDNAIKYMHRETGGKITVSYRVVDGQHEFKVSDNGSGIPVDKQDQIFCVFRRGDAASTKDVGGKGVGLAVVRSIVMNYGGRIWVESTPGEGASFIFTLAQEATQPTQQKEVLCV
ncbi:MAG: HAMP domain-containing histidine kinase [Phycisphaerae bacterium]|nr:HAMP domain-containing histidine kinase [Phycisphaerae bacterium]